MINPQIQELLDTVTVAGLATVNADASPWATAIHFTHDDQFFYWFSPESATHSLNIARHASISLTVWSADESQGLYGLYLQSKAEKTDDLETAKAAYIAKFKAFPESFAPYAAYRAPLGSIDPVRSNGKLWYLSHQ